MKQTNKSKVSKFPLITFILFMLTPPITALITLLNKYINQRKRIKNSKATRTLSLNNLTEPITIEELIVIDKPKSFFYNYNETTNKSYIKYYFSKFLNFEWNKEYIFDNKKLNVCIYKIEKRCNNSDQKNIYDELKKLNGDPDEIHSDRKIFLSEYVWYGKNGTISYMRYSKNMVQIIFNLNKEYDHEKNV